MNSLPFEGKRSSFYLGIFWGFQSRDTTQMYLQIVGIYCHGKYKQYDTLLEDSFTAPYEPFKKIALQTW